MQLRIFTEPQQGATYSTLLAVAQATEQHGFDAFFRSDHFLGMGAGDHLPGPTDAWLTLAALARDTTRIRLGTLLTSATFRLPGLLAVQVAQVDEMSGGRVELGLGAGWYDAEHAAYGVPFPPVAERFDRLEEQLAVITGLWATSTGDTFCHAGAHYQLVDSPALPRPVQSPRPPVIVGGHGTRRTPELAARYADEFNIAFADLDVSRTQLGRVRRACEDAGRDPDSLVYSVAATLLAGTDERDVQRRADDLGRDLDALRPGSGIVGTPEQIIGRIGEYAAMGASRVYLQLPSLDVAAELVTLVGEQVLPHV